MRARYVQYDFVVGNPPYIRSRRITLKYVKELARDYPAIFSGKADLYIYFIGRAIEWLNQKGRLGFITSNKFLQARYGKKLKTLILQNCLIERLVNFGDSGVFSDVTNYPCIFVLIKGKGLFREPKYVRVIRSRDQILQHIGTHLSEARYSDEYLDIFKLKEAPDQKDRILMPEEEYEPYLKIERNAESRLRDISDIRMGLHCVPRKLLVINQMKKNELSLEDKVVKPLLEGKKDVKRWNVSWRCLYIVFPYENVDDELISVDLYDYPNLYDYLERHHEVLENRKFYRKKIIEYGKKWYELWNPFWFERPRALGFFKLRVRLDN